MRKIALIIVIIAIPAALFAGTLLEQSLKGYDPYLADRDGFDSLFVNPAGISGDTQIFTLSIEGGTWGRLENYKLLRDNLDTMTSLGTGGSITPAEAADLMPLMLDEIDQATWDDLRTGTGLPANSSTVDWTSVSQADLDQISTNISGDAALQEALMNQFDDVNYSVESEIRFGTLIRGFGLGIYNNNYFLYSLGAQGIEDMVFETGAVAGYGFDIGAFSLGFSGKFALLLADDPMYPFNVASGQIKNQQVLYGYAWGVDAGVIWEPVQSLSLALLVSDIIGSVTPVEDMGSGTIDAFLSGNAAGPSGGYSWSTDLGVGLTWEPEWRFIRPKFSLDMYDMVAMIREYTDPDYSGVQDFYLSGAEPFLRHMRLGANLRFLGFLDVGASYYMEYITLGAGVDLKIFEAYMELKTKQNFSDVGANAMVKVKF